MPRFALLVLLVLAVSCGGKKGSAIAKLTKAEGPVEKQVGEGAWKAANIGTEFVIGDAARTAEGIAQLELIGGAQIAMQAHTVLRFGGKAASSKIVVELGAIELTGTGSYGIDVGDIKLSAGDKVRITSKGVEMLIGDAEVVTIGGKSIDLVVGQAVDFGAMTIDVVTIDAGVVDAAVVAVADAAIDAPEALAGDEALIEVTGKRVEVQAPGTTEWIALAPGAGTLAKGSKVRVGAGSSAKITARGTTLEMAGGSRMTLSDDLAMRLETGTVRASSAVAAEGNVDVPGGAVALQGTAQTGAEAKLDTNARETRVTVARGTAKLTGASGGELAMNRGETATVAKTGSIRVVEAIPTFFDIAVNVGATMTIHDPRGATAVKFSFGGNCPDGGFIEMDKDNRYRTAKVSAGKNEANMMVGGGSWAYRLRCTKGGVDSIAVGSGRLVVRRDAGTRKLLPEATFTIDTDGRAYGVTFASVVPNIAVRIKGGGGPFTLNVAQGGKATQFTGPGPEIKIPGNQLKEGTYTYWLERNGVKDPKVSTLNVAFNNTAPQVYLESPVNGRKWEGDIEVRGAVLPGWTAAVDDVTIPMDKQRRFTATLKQRPAGNALAIRLSHPQRGVHYYLRRPAK